MEETGCEVICGAPPTLAVKAQVKVKVKTSGKKEGNLGKPGFPAGGVLNFYTRCYQGE